MDERDDLAWIRHMPDAPARAQQGAARVDLRSIIGFTWGWAWKLGLAYYAGMVVAGMRFQMPGWMDQHSVSAQLVWGGAVVLVVLWSARSIFWSWLDLEIGWRGIVVLCGVFAAGVLGLLSQWGIR